MAKRDCFDEAKVGLLIKTFTGDKKGNIICDVGPRKDVRHLVRMTNLLAYWTDVECDARITTTQRIIRFTSPAEESWADRCTLKPFSHHTFSHVAVLSAPPFGEDQQIKVDLKINRLQRGDEESASLSITVRS
jgi:hypothetical protein